MTPEEQWLNQLEGQGLDVVRARFMDRMQTGWGDGASVNWIVANVDAGGGQLKRHPNAKFVREWISEKDTEKTKSEQTRHAQVIRLARVAAWASVIGLIVSIVGILVALSKVEL